MCGLSLMGRQAIPFLESLVIADVVGLKDSTGTLTVFTNEKGGAIGDSVITKVNDQHIYLVVNAGCRDKDLAHIGSTWRPSTRRAATSSGTSTMSGRCSNCRSVGSVALLNLFGE
jgi:glycine cleavage system aminomethyltransferase T